MSKSPFNMSRTEFIRAFGAIYEHSPWMAEKLYDTGLTSNHNKCENLTQAFQQLFSNQPKTRQLEVIKAHPDLAGKLAINNELSAHSSNEQNSAGLDQCSTEEFETFKHYNQNYKAKFDFPFIKAVKGQNRRTILKEFEQRLDNSYQQEFATALSEINKIADFRLQDWFDQHQIVNLASANAGAQVLFATDDFFAAKQRLIQDQEPVFKEGVYDNHGKWMDGWESRRKRATGHDYCIVKLTQSGRIDSIVIDTAFFTGNYPPCASLDACQSDADALPEDTNWQSLLPAVSLNGDHKHEFKIQSDQSFSHMRLNIFPDGGVARLRVYGQPDG